MPDHQSYLKFFIVLILVLCSSIAGFNFIVDPSNTFRVINKIGFNDVKPKIGKYQYYWKTDFVRTQQPQVLLMGNSCSEIGLNPESYMKLTENKNETTFNTAIPASSIYSIYRLIQHAVTESNPKNIIVGIDYSQFTQRYIDNDKNYFIREAIEPLLAVDENKHKNNYYVLSRNLKLLLSRSIFKDSIYTLESQNNEPKVKSKYGQTLSSYMEYEINHESSPIKFYNESLSRNIKTNLLLSEEDIETSSGEEYFKKIIFLKNKYNFNLTFFIQPVHITKQALSTIIYQEESYIEWKKFLIDQIQKNNSSPLTPINLYDFSLLTQVMDSSSPTKTKLMDDYYDLTHYKSEVGDVLLDEIFNRRTEYLLTEKKLNYNTSFIRKNINTFLISKNGSEFLSELKEAIDEKTTPYAQAQVNKAIRRTL